MRLAPWVLALGLLFSGCDRLGPTSQESTRDQMKIEHPGESDDSDRKGDVEGRPSPVGGGIIYDSGL